MNSHLISKIKSTPIIFDKKSRTKPLFYSWQKYQSMRKNKKIQRRKLRITQVLKKNIILTENSVAWHWSIFNQTAVSWSFVDLAQYIRKPESERILSKLAFSAWTMWPPGWAIVYLTAMRIENWTVSSAVV